MHEGTVTVTTLSNLIGPDSGLDPRFSSYFYLHLDRTAMSLVHGCTLHEDLTAQLWPRGNLNESETPRRQAHRGNLIALLMRSLLMEKFVHGEMMDH
jgi:hypothetical protein